MPSPDSSRSISHLPKNTQLLAFTIAMVIDVGRSDLYFWFSKDTKALKTRPSLAKEQIDKINATLIEKGIIVPDIFGMRIAEAYQYSLPGEVFLEYPDACRAIAKLWLRVHRNHLKLPREGKHVTLGMMKSLDELKTWAAALLFSNSYSNFATLLDKGHELLPNSEKLNKQNYQQQIWTVATEAPRELFRHLDEVFFNTFLSFSSIFDIPELDEENNFLPLAEMLRGVKGNTEEAQEIHTLALSQPELLHQEKEAILHLPGLLGPYSILYNDDKSASKAFAAMKNRPKYVTISNVLRELYYWQKGEIDINDICEHLNHFRYSETPAIINAFSTAVHARRKPAAFNENSLLRNLDDIEHLASPIAFFSVLCVFSSDIVKDQLKYRLINFAKEQNWDEFPYPKGEFHRALTYLMPEDHRVPNWTKIADDLAEKYGWRYLSDWLQPSPEREANRLLGFLKKLATPDEKVIATIKDTERFIYLIDHFHREIEIKVQKLNKKGNWTSGRLISAEKFGAKAFLNELDEIDAQVAMALTDSHGNQPEYHYYGGQSTHCYSYGVELHYSKALYFLADHPNVALDNKQRTPVSITKAEPSFSVVDTPNGVQLAFTPRGAAGKFHIERTTPTHFTVYELSDEERQLSQKLLSPTVIPNEQRKALEETLPLLRKSIRVSSLIDIDTEALDKVEGQTIPTAHLLPHAEGGYDVQLVLQPIPDVNYFVTPGEGQPQDIITLDPEADEPQRVLLSRKQELELVAVTALLDACPSLSELAGGNALAATISDPQDALYLLRELQSEQAAGRINVEYPKGQKLKLSQKLVDSKDLQLGISKARDWFAVSGHLQLDENRVLDFQQLLAHARSSNGQFVQLDDGEYLALSDQLQAQIKSMDALLHERKGQAALPQLAATAFEDLLADLEDVELDEAWQEQLTRADQAKKVRPRLPKHFNANLRDYQLDGFKWMMRLAAWGVGGCLADDMGLGKTVQALAVLTARAKKGPALVLAPASVTRNWMRETERFAPTLTPILVASSSEAHLVDEAGNGDVLVVSYGLLGWIGDALSLKPDSDEPRHFGTIILDEAQAIKNPASKRARLVFELKADFKLALTGTPIENSLGELWSLFRYLNPGLLGSLQAFTSKYARPLSATNALPELAEQLRRLVQPFILRRRKDEVLKELPAKTEIVLEVEPGDKERALYEAIRREAVDQIANATTNQQRFMVLQQLTRLRQAACHPKLVRPNSKLPSAKLTLVAETIQELLANGHRALIFSQFVKHLKLIEAWIKQAEIPYLYLDGSTPGKKREQLVNSFQAGEAELFLISLKAGGTGLNLTAADYVLHLDPWWNPAAEDQASDRAHRIGQQRPVTVYRFVTVGTIEESILQLHADKRDLADQVLSGADASAKLSVEQMVKMVGG